MNFSSLAVRIKNKLLSEIDQLNWWYSTAPLRSEKNMQSLRSTLFVCALMSIPATAKAEGLFAAVLRRRGYKLVVLLNSRSPLLERCYRAAGPVEFIYLKDYIDHDDVKIAQDQAREYLTIASNFDDLFELVVNGVRIGRNVLSKAIRTFRVGKIDFSNFDQLATIEKLLSESLKTSRAIQKILAQVKPSVALFNERGYTPAGEIFDACLVNNIEVIQWFGAPLENCLAYKRYRLDNRDQHPLSISDKGWNLLLSHKFAGEMQNRILFHLKENYKADGWYNHQQLNIGKSLKSKSEIYHQLDLDPAKKTAVIFSHILYDATFFYGSSLFADYLTWLVETVRYAIKNAALNWIVKVHPVNVWRSRMDGAPMEQLEVKALHEAFGELPSHIKFLTADSDINTYSLFSFIDYGLTVRGTIGMELPCFGIPVIIAGTGRYSGRGFTLDTTSIAEYNDLLLRLHEIPPLGEEEIRKARLFAYGTLILRAIPMDVLQFKFEETSLFSRSKTMNVKLDRTRAAKLQDSDDLGLFQNWVSKGKGDELFREFV
jgi:hypothetical protein